MTLYAGHALAIAIGAAGEVPDYVALKAVRNCRWQLEHRAEPLNGVAEDAWMRQSAIVQRGLRLECHLYGASHVAQARIRAAALGAGRVMAKITLPDGAVMEGEMFAESYAEVSQDDAMLEVEVLLVSAGAMSVTL